MVGLPEELLASLMTIDANVTTSSKCNAAIMTSKCVWAIAADVVTSCAAKTSRSLLRVLYHSILASPRLGESLPEEQLPRVLGSYRMRSKMLKHME